MTERESLFDDVDLGVAVNDRERVLLAEIDRLRKERDEAVESSLYHLAEFKRTYRDYLDLKEPDRCPEAKSSLFSRARSLDVHRVGDKWRAVAYDADLRVVASTELAGDASTAWRRLMAAVSE